MRMNDIYVVGVGMTKFGRLLERSVYDMVGEAVGLALKDAGCARGRRYWLGLLRDADQWPVPGPDRDSRADRHAPPGHRGHPGV
jgi:hypothetical protein